MCGVAVVLGILRSRGLVGGCGTVGLGLGFAPSRGACCNLQHCIWVWALYVKLNGCGELSCSSSEFGTLIDKKKKIVRYP